MIRLEGLTKRYGDFTAVDDVDLEIPGGQIFGLLGPNGAGKTTTLRMIVGILRPDAGRVLVDGHDVASDAFAAKSRLGFVPDRPFVYEKLTGEELLRFVAGLYGQDGDEVEEESGERRAIEFRPGMTMSELEREAIVATLREVDGNRRKAAEQLGIGERTLYRKISKYELEV